MDENDLRELILQSSPGNKFCQNTSLGNLTQSENPFSQKPARRFSNSPNPIKKKLRLDSDETESNRENLTIKFSTDTSPLKSKRKNRSRKSRKKRKAEKISSILASELTKIDPNLNQTVPFENFSTPPPVKTTVFGQNGPHTFWPTTDNHPQVNRSYLLSIAQREAEIQKYFNLTLGHQGSITNYDFGNI